MRAYMRGFTLIEILVVVTILAIAAGIAVPSISNGYDNIRVPSTARMVMSDLLYAQNCAVTQQQRMYVYFINDNQSPARTAYTIASFPGETSAPSGISFSTINSTTAVDFTASDGKKGKFLVQPTSLSRYLVQFGPGGGENAPGPLSRTVINSVQIGTSSATVFGFDSLGQPVDISGNALVQPITIEFENLRGDVSQKLEISPITGEINVP